MKNQGKLMRVATSSVEADTSINNTEALKHGCSLEYEFYSFTRAAPVVHVFSLPAHPLNNQFSMRYAISIDEEPPMIVDFRTHGRTEKW